MVKRRAESLVGFWGALGFSKWPPGSHLPPAAPFNLRGVLAEGSPYTCQPCLILQLGAAVVLSPEQLPCALVLNLAIETQACRVTLE